jgi:hypothetical protein
MSKRITHIRVSDGGDGSTFFKLAFDDGTFAYENPDIPYDGHVMIYVAADGTTQEVVVDE